MTELRALSSNIITVNHLSFQNFQIRLMQAYFWAPGPTTYPLHITKEACNDFLVIINWLCHS